MPYLKIKQPKAGDKGILFGNFFIPLYEADLKFPTAGMVFYAPLSSDSSTAESGHTLTKNGTVKFCEVAGIPCAKFSDSKIDFSVENLPAGNAPRTLSIWAKRTGIEDYMWFFIFGYGDNGTAVNVYLGEMSDSRLGLDLGNSAFTSPSNVLKYEEWNHLCAVTSPETGTRLYVNGVKVAENTSFSASSTRNVWGKIGGSNFTGYLSAARIYNRVLNDEEIILLSKEFVAPVASDGLVFYTPLVTESELAETGQVLRSHGNTITYTTIDGIPCARIDHGYLKTTQMTGMPIGNQPWTISAKINVSSINYWPWALYFGRGGSSYMQFAGFMGNRDKSGKFGFHGSNWTEIYGDCPTGSWHTLTATYDGTTVKYYIDAVLINTMPSSINLGSDFISIGSGDSLTNNTDAFVGYIAAVRIYNRVINSAEISALAAEIPVVPPPPPVELVFHAPLDATKAAAETGQPLTAQGTVTFATTDAVPSAVFDKSAYLVSSAENLPSGDSDRTVSAWVKCLSNSTDSGSRDTFFAYGSGSNNQAYQCSVIGGTGQLHISGGYDGGNECASENGGAVSTWMHVCIIHKNSVDYFYINGVAAGSFSHARNTGSTSAYVGIGVDVGQANTFKGNIAALRVYNGAISDAKLAELASEFTPVVTPPAPQLVFHAPLASNSATAATGQTLEANGSISYTTIDGIPCAKFNRGHLKTTQMTGFPFGNQPWTMSLMINASTVTQPSWPFLLFWGVGNMNTNNKSIGFIGFNDSGTPEIALRGNSPTGTWYTSDKAPISLNTWYSIIGTFDGTTAKFYVNGALIGTIADCSFNIGMDFLTIADGDCFTGTSPFLGHIAAVRIYNYAISAAEIAELASEFTPSIESTTKG